MRFCLTKSVDDQSMDFNEKVGSTLKTEESQNRLNRTNSALLLLLLQLTSVED